MQPPLIKDSSGKPSMSVTFAWISFAYVICAISLGLVEEITIGTNTFKFRMLDAGLVASLLGPVFALYGYRRLIDRPTPPTDDLKKCDIPK